MSYEESMTLSAKAAKVFQPRTPITTKELFAGRWDELVSIVDAVNQPGLHAVIYGERGVGKTSLANVVSPTIWAFDQDDKKAPERLVVKVVASSGDTFSSIWRKLFQELTFRDNQPVIGLVPGPKKQKSIIEAYGLSDTITVDDVRRVLARIPKSVFIIDEFDRVVDKTSKDFTDLIKALSDYALDCTIVIVGVSDTIDQLIDDHASIVRAISQVFLPRMNPTELNEILKKAESSLKVYFSEEAKRLTVHISQGLPHYIHLIGLHSVRVAAENLSRHINRDHIFEALKVATKRAEQSARDKHSKATHSAHKDALYLHVLLACAVTATQSQDALGYFSPRAVVEPLVVILGRKTTIATFNNHLSEFCQPKRGEVLERDGQPRAYRFRFHDPMVVPFVLMDAVSRGIVAESKLTKMLDGKFTISS